MAYDAANSAGSNLGPTNKKLIDAVKANVDAARKDNPNAPVPIDHRHDVGLGIRPAHFAAERGVPGAACGTGAWHAGRRAPRARGGNTEGGSSASWASRA